MMKRICRVITLAAFAAIPAVASAQPPLVMVFREKPPYSYVEQGRQKGFLLERTRHIVEKAGLTATFEVLPTKRIFAELEANQRPICTFGWYKNRDRERYAKFTQPIHLDRPHILLASSRSLPAIKPHKSLKSLLSDPSLTLAVVDGTSYGPELDAMIGRFAGRVEKGLVSPQLVARKVAGNRADFMFMDQDDYEYLLATNSEFANEGLVRVEFPDLPPGLRRYILCSKSVDNDVIARLNGAIARLPLVDKTR